MISSYPKNVATSEFLYQTTKSISRIENLVVKINFYETMFELKELKIMFLDPTDLIINKINRLLNSNKTIKFIFS